MQHLFCLFYFEKPLIFIRLLMSFVWFVSYRSKTILGKTRKAVQQASSAISVVSADNECSPRSSR